MYTYTTIFIEITHVMRTMNTFYLCHLLRFQSQIEVKNLLPWELCLHGSDGVPTLLEMIRTGRRDKHKTGERLLVEFHEVVGEFGHFPCVLHDHLHLVSWITDIGDGWRGVFHSHILPLWTWIRNRLVTRTLGSFKHQSNHYEVKWVHNCECNECNILMQEQHNMYAVVFMLLILGFETLMLYMIIFYL